MSNDKQSSVEYLIKEFSEILGPISTNPMQDLLLVDAINQAKARHKEEAQQYAEFCVTCDRGGLPLLDFDGWINLQNETFGGNK